MPKKQETLSLFKEVEEATRKLNNEQFGALMRAAFAYRFSGHTYSGSDDVVDMAFSFVASQIDRYREICEAKAEAAKERWDKAKDMQKNAKGTEECKSVEEVQTNAPIHSNPIHSNPIHSNPIHSDDDIMGENSPTPTPTPAHEKPKRTKFIPPTLEEVRAYCQSRNNSVNPERFVAYYNSNGWQVGRNKMKDWKAAVITWENNGYDSGKKQNQTFTRDLDFDEQAAIRRIMEG